MSGDEPAAHAAPADLSGDPFGTAAIRERVLAGWTAAAVRFREDANAEEDLALGGYRDRVVVELAQNAADAATTAAVPGRLLLALRELPGGPVLVAANTGAPLDADGVLALSTLRASAKRNPDAEAVGRFGVGFSAVLALTDEPAVLSRTGGVRFSAADTLDLVRERATTELAQELTRRDGHVPVLRLPFATDGEPPEGYDTAVILPLRDGSAHDLAVRLLAEVDDALLLALPGLEQVRIEGPAAVRPRTLEGVEARWHVVRRSGEWDAAVLADRPTEERRRTTWSLAWALPIGDGDGVPDVVHAPTPTDEPLPWRALLIATFPLDPDRRSVAPGEATDTLVREAAAAYADLVASRARAGDDVWPLVPVGLPAGRLDGALRAAALESLAGEPVLRAVKAPEGEPQLVRPRDAVVLDQPAGGDERAVTALAASVAGLVLAPRAALAAVTALGVPTLALADVVDQLPQHRSARQWHAMYDALTGIAIDPLVREALSALPVPLADGRVVRGARGALLAADGDLAGALAVLGVRVVDPAAAHPLLERLGAQPAGPRTVLDLPEVHAAVATSLDLYEDDEAQARQTVDAVLALVAVAVADGWDGGHVGPARPTGGADGLADSASDALTDGLTGDLGRLALRDADGEPTPANELVLPGSFAAEVLDDDEVAVVDPDLLDRWGPDVLRAVGVLDTLAVVRALDVPLVGEEPPEGLADLPDWDDWVEATLQGAGSDATEATCSEVVAVRDLDLVRDDAWPRVLRALATDPRTRRALVEPATVSVRGDDGVRAIRARSWTAWWLRRELLDGAAWADLDAGGAVGDLLGRLDPQRAALVEGLDAPVRAALGGVRHLREIDLAGVGTLLARFGDPDVAVELPVALTAWSGLAALVAVLPSDAELEIPAPPSVRALDPASRTTVAVAAGRAVIVDGPMWLQRLDLGPLIVAPGPAAAEALADLLDVALARDEAPGLVDEAGAAKAVVPHAVHALLPSAPDTWCEHEDDVLVDGQAVQWWVTSEGAPVAVHASTLDGLARGLAWAAGAWGRRQSVAEVLAAPTALADLLLDETFPP